MRRVALVARHRVASVVRASARGLALGVVIAPGAALAASAEVAIPEVGIQATTPLTTVRSPRSAGTGGGTQRVAPTTAVGAPAAAAPGPTAPSPAPANPDILT